MVGSVEERKERLLRELGDVEEFLKEEVVVREDFPKDVVFDGRLEPLGGGRYSFSGSVKHPDKGVLEFEDAVLEKTDKGYTIQGTAKKLVGWIPLDEGVQPATEEDIKKYARVSEDYKIKGKLVGRLFRVGDEQVLVDDKHKVIVRGCLVGVVGGGYRVGASKDGGVRGVVEVGGEKYETKHPDEVLLVVPKKGVVARGWDANVLGGGYWVRASEDGSVKGVIKIGDRIYKTEKPWEGLLVVPKEKVVARGWRLDYHVMGGGYRVRASEDGSIKAVVEIGGMRFENDKGFKILKTDKGYEVKPLREE